MDSDYVNHEQHMSHGNHMGRSEHMPNMNHMGHHESHDMSMNDPSMLQDPSISLNASDIHGQMSHGDHSMHSGHNMRAGEHDMHSGHSMGSGGHMMSMSFHGGVTETILFSWWNTAAAGEFIGSFIAIFMCAVLYEGLKYYRKHLLWKTYAGLQYCAVAPPDKGISNVCSPDDAQVIQLSQHNIDHLSTRKKVSSRQPVYSTICNWTQSCGHRSITISRCHFELTD